MQQALLKIIEGTTLQLQTKPTPKPPSGLPGSPSSFNPPLAGGATSPPKSETVTIDTSSILFIFTGAFIGLDRIISTRIGAGSIGFSSPLPPPIGTTAPPTPLDACEPRDLVQYGLIPELVGRIPITTAVIPLTASDLVRVLTEPANAILQQYTHLLSLSDVELRFTSAALHSIANTALKMGTGARGLRTVLEGLLGDAMFESPGTSVRHVLVNEDVAEKRVPAAYFARGQRHRFCALVAEEEREWVRRGNRSYLGEMKGADDEVATPGTPPAREVVAGYV